METRISNERSPKCRPSVAETTDGKQRQLMFERHLYLLTLWKKQRFFDVICRFLRPSSGPRNIKCHCLALAKKRPSTKKAKNVMVLRKQFAEEIRRNHLLPCRAALRCGHQTGTEGRDNFTVFSVCEASGPTEVFWLSKENADHQRKFLQMPSPLWKRNNQMKYAQLEDAFDSME